MKVQVKNLPNCAREIRVEVPSDKVQTEVDSLYAQISQEAKVDGFRKGKAPLNIIRQKFKDTVKKEMSDSVMPRFFQEALDTEKLQPVSKPRVKDYVFEEGQPMKFTAHIEVRPEFEMKNYKGIKVRKESVEVQEEQVANGLEQLREHAAQFIPRDDRPLGKGDLAVIDFEGRLGGVPFEGGKAQRYPVFLGTGDMIPGFEEALEGMAKGATRTFPLKFPEDYPKKDLASKEAEFTVTVHEIKEKKLPELDDEFARSAGGCDNLALLREKVSAQIHKARENEQRSKMIDQIADRLIKDHKFEIPESWVALETFQAIRNGIQHLRQHGVDPNGWDEKQKKEYNDRMRAQAERNVRLALLVDHVAEAEGVRCEGKDWEAYLQKVADDSGQPVEAVKQYVRQQGNEEQLRDRIRYEKTMDLLLDVANIEQK